MNSNFTIKAKGPMSNVALELGFSDFDQLCLAVQQLAYGRNSNRHDFSLVLKENKGTCSSKHAFLHQVCIENDQSHIQLILGMYLMTADNTVGIRSILSKYNINGIPEAHCYLKFQDQRLDYTKPLAKFSDIALDLLEESNIQSTDVISHKIDIHQTFIQQWIDNNNINYSFQEIWEIRELCIQALSV